MNLNDKLEAIVEELEQKGVKQERTYKDKDDPNRWQPITIDDLQETLSYDEDGETYGDYTFAFVTGYTGAEGGEESVSFVCRINDDHYHVDGYYDSWAGGEIYWNNATPVVPEDRTYKAIRTDYVDANGNIFESKTHKEELM